ncbi:polyketide synthase dehydratase-domain-containing protein [Aspergillus falconensis]
MAPKAVISRAPMPTAIRAVEFTNVTFETGLAPPDNGLVVDISLTLLPHAVMDGMHNFSIYSECPDSTRRLAHGSVAAVCHVGNPLDPVELAAQEQEWEAAQWVLREAHENATVHINHRIFYESLAALRLSYGPTFRGLDRITVSREHRTACSWLKVPDTRSVMPEQFEYPHFLHPATADCSFQLSFAAFQAQDGLRQPFVPASAGRIFISTDLPSSAGSSFIGTSSARHADGSVVAESLFTDADASAPKIVIDSLAMTNVGDSSSETAEIPARTANLVWKEDVSSVIGSHVGNFLEWIDTWLDSFRHKYADANELFVAAAEHLAWVESSNMAGQITLLEPCEDGQFVAFSHGQRRALPQHVVQQKLTASASYYAVVVDARLSDQIAWLSASLPSIMKPCGHLVMFGRGGCDDLAGDTWLEELIKDKGYSLLQIPNSQLQVALAAPGPGSTIQVPFTTEKDSITILERGTTEQTLQLCQTLVQLLSAAGIHNVRVVHWNDPIASFRNQCVVYLVENGCPFFYDMSGKGLTHFRNLIASRPRYLLWTTTGNLLAPDETGIQYAPATGSLRTARSEYPLLPLQHLDLSHEACQMPGTAAGIIVNVLLTTLQSAVQPMETEVAESGGKLYIPRLIADKAMDVEIGRDVKPSACLPVPLSDPRHPTRLQVSPDGSVH